jgi:hypothetical protein
VLPCNFKFIKNTPYLCGGHRLSCEKKAKINERKKERKKERGGKKERTFRTKE